MNKDKKRKITEELLIRAKIRKHWLMYLRKIYLAYNAVLAGLLLFIEGCCIGLGLFYTFKNINDENDLTLFEKTFKQANIVFTGLLSLFTISLILSHFVNFIKLTSSHGQYSIITRKISSFFETFFFCFPKKTDNLVEL